VGLWAPTGETLPVGLRERLGGRSVTTAVHATGAPARIEDYAEAAGAIAAVGQNWGAKVAVGVSAIVEGRRWGVMTLTSRRSPLPADTEERLADTEERLADFTELIAVAIACPSRSSWPRTMSSPRG